MLYWVHPDSGNYDDEELWLDTSQLRPIREEYQNLCAVCRRKLFIPGLDGAEVFEHWRKQYDVGEFGNWLSEIDSVLELTIQANGVALLLL